MVDTVALRAVALWAVLLGSSSAMGDDAHGLQRLIDAAIASGQQGPVTVTARAGASYYFNTTSLLIAGAHGLEIVAAASASASAAPAPPAELLFECGAGVHIANSSDVTFRNFIIDYPQPCFAQGQLVRLKRSSTLTAGAGLGTGKGCHSPTVPH